MRVAILAEQAANVAGCRPGRSYASRQAAKTTLFAAANAGAVSKKSLAIFSNELVHCESHVCDAELRELTGEPIEFGGARYRTCAHAENTGLAIEG